MQDPIDPSWSIVFEESSIKGNFQGKTYSESDVQIKKTSWALENLNSVLSQLLVELSNRKESAANQIVQINDLDNPKFTLNNPISLIISFENGIYFAEVVDFNLYGGGLNIKEAIDNLKNTIITYYQSLNKYKKKLSKSSNKKYIGLFKISMGSKEFGKVLIGIMARQLGISSEQLRRIVNCTFWANDFILNSRLLHRDLY